MNFDLSQVGLELLTSAHGRDGSHHTREPLSQSIAGFGGGRDHDHPLVAMNGLHGSAGDRFR